MSPPRRPIEHVLSDNLKFRRKKVHMSQENVATYAGLTIHAYREIEEERYIPNINVLIRLARALGCKIDDLLPIDEIE